MTTVIDIKEPCPAYTGIVADPVPVYKRKSYLPEPVTVVPEKKTIYSVFFKPVLTLLTILLAPTVYLCKKKTRPVYVAFSLIIMASHLIAGVLLFTYPSNTVSVTSKGKTEIVSISSIFACFFIALSILNVFPILLYCFFELFCWVCMYELE